MTEWNKGDLDSFLIEITADILKFKDDKGEYLVEKIRDAAGQVSCDTTVLLHKLVCIFDHRKALENGQLFQPLTKVFLSL